MKQRGPRRKRAVGDTPLVIASSLLPVLSVSVTVHERGGKVSRGFARAATNLVTENRWNRSYTRACFLVAGEGNPVSTVLRKTARRQVDPLYSLAFTRVRSAEFFFPSS